MKLGEIIVEENVIFLDTLEMKDTIKLLIDKAYEKGKIADKKNFEKAVLEREEIVSTGIGFGVAIPHAKLNNIKEFFIIVGITKKGLDWDAIDRKPVRAVFLIGGPEGEQKEYLKIISKLILLIKNGDRREKLFQATNEKEIIEIFQNF